LVCTLRNFEGKAPKIGINWPELDNTIPVRFIQVFGANIKSILSSSKTSGKMAQRKTKSSGTQYPAISAIEGRQLVIVESPAKARTINTYLGPDYVVSASIGHVRDLPDKNPKGSKNPVPGVDLGYDFKPTYEIIKERAETVKQLKQAAKKASGIWLATDLDREGEAIAWHLTQALGVTPEHANRVVFNAITRSEIEKAFRHPRKIDMDKVNAQQARRILDRIVGYQVSPLLWKKVGRGLSAGRVQSVAVRLVVEREREIEMFIPDEYWRVAACFTTDLKQAAPLAQEWQKWLSEAPSRGNNKKSHDRKAHEKNRWLSEHKSFAAELIEIDGKKFDPKDVEATLAAVKQAGFHLDKRIETQNPQARGPARRIIRLRGHLIGGPAWRAKLIQSKRVKSRPYAPFITSTLQQAAASQLGFSPQLTMKIAQALYEGIKVHGKGSVGLITYMRTDSTHLSVESINMARNYIGSTFGDSYLPTKPHVFASSAKAAQEAHEAIRPTDVSLTPEQVRSSLNDRQYRLYKIIWERFVACQMAEAQWDSTTVLISGSADSGELVFKATGRVLIFDGYYKVVGVPPTADEVLLPPLAAEQPLAAIQIDPTQNFTSPPPRYTEASLVKKLEAEGIGRPSTYAQIIQVIQNRKYVEKTQNLFYATDLGKIVTDKLIEAFPEILQVSYTSEMEQQLDNIEEKHADWVQMLKDFYGPFKQRLDGAYKAMGHAKAEIQPAPLTCPQCGSDTVYRFGRNGRFLSCSQYPKCKFAAPIDRNGKPVAPEQTEVACPKCGTPMLLRKGRFGPFLSCSKYPDCDGILNIDKRGSVIPPKTPPLLTDIPCPKCGAPLNLRRGTRGLWLSCSTFPNCSGKVSWDSLEENKKVTWEKALDEHEQAHPQEIIRTLDGTPLGDNYKPKVRTIEDEATDEQ
jgi:DNA topoisomerase-1